MKQSSSRSPLLTIDEYLSLSDWVFQARIEEGQYEDFLWVRLAHHIDFADYVDLPQQPYHILITYFDGPGASCIGKDPGWRLVGDCALSDLISKQPEINYGADTELMILDKTLTDEQILSGLSLADVETDPSDPKFWRFLQRFHPYCYVSSKDSMFFTAKSKILVEELQSDKVLADIERQERDYLSNSRAALWSSLGPECGPEKCIEDGCDRSRIQLAVRCFMHQLNGSN